jgi:hypothetical protein
MKFLSLCILLVLEQSYLNVYSTYMSKHENIDIMFYVKLASLIQWWASIKLNGYFYYKNMYRKYIYYLYDDARCYLDGCQAVQNR